MVGGGGNGEGGEQAPPPSMAARPVTTLRPRASVESVYSPGPMTLLSNFFGGGDGDGDGDGDECKSFSELLAGAMVDPTALSPTFFLPPGFIDSPSQGHFGMTQQQMLSQITSQAVPSHFNVQIQSEHPFTIPPPSMPESRVRETESLDYPHSEQKLHSSSLNIADKPNNDGYNWRKYGQKHVKGCDFSRSYYKCTHPKCPVKKKLERSLEGHVTAIIYKGEHNHHQPPNPNNKIITKDNNNILMTSNESSSDRLKEEIMSSHLVYSKRDLESNEHGSGTSDSEEVVGDHETTEADEKNDEPDTKRRNIEARPPDPATLHRSVAEPRIIVQTTSEVDLLDDGYRWRKYGQKVVKGNPYPRSYYKCTTKGCNVRKHVERASTDPKAVITTYEGKHNHDVPAAKSNSHTLANNSASQLKKAQNIAISEEKHSFSSNEQRPVASLRLKEEQIT